MSQVLSATTPAGYWHVTVALRSGDTTEQAHAVMWLGAVQAAGFFQSNRMLLAAAALVAILALAAWLFTRRPRMTRR